MSAAPWTLQQDHARLRLGNLEAALHLARPDLGLVQLKLANASLPGSALLGLAIPAPPADCYVRGDDLAAVYEQSDQWPVRVDALWRATCDASATATIELVVSVRTSLLDSQPEIEVRSALPADDVLWVTPEAAETHRTLSFTGDGTVLVDAGDGPGCLLFRPSGSEFSYAQMVHPADLRHTLLRREPDGPIVHAAHALFLDPLEKGVILRGRIRGLFLPRASDVDLAAAEFLAFAAEEPLLGT